MFRLLISKRMCLLEKRLPGPWDKQCWIPGLRNSERQKKMDRAGVGTVAGGGVGGYRSESVQNGLGAGERELVSVQNRVFRIALHSTVKGDPTSVRHLQELS